MPERKKDKRRLILDAAVEVFAAQGFHRSRVSDIARRAEIADGTIYLYFKSKDDVLISVFEERMGELIEDARAFVSEAQDPRERLRRFARFHVAMAEQNRSLAAVFLVEIRLSNRFMKDYQPQRLKEYLDLIGEIVEDGQRAGVFRPDVNPIVVRRAFFGALDETAMQWILTPGSRRRYRLEPTAEEITEIFIRGLAHGAEAPTPPSPPQTAFREEVAP